MVGFFVMMLKFFDWLSEEVTDDENESGSSDEDLSDAMSQDVSVSGEEDEDDNEYETLTVTEGAQDDEQYDKNLDLTEEYETLNKIKGESVSTD